MSDKLTFYVVVFTTVLQVISGIFQLKFAALIFSSQYFDLYLSLLLLTGIFILAEQSILTACINIFNESSAEALTKKNIIVLLSMLFSFYVIIILFYLIYAQINMHQASISITLVITLIFTCKSCSIVISNILAAKRQIITEKLIKMCTSLSITLAFFICWIFVLDDMTSILVVLSAAVGALLLSIIIMYKLRNSHSGDQAPIFREIVSTLHYLLPGSIYVLILPTAVSIFGTTNEKATLAILRQVILAGSAMVLSPTTSYLILFVNALKRAVNHELLIQRLNKFLTIAVFLIFSGAFLTLVNFDQIYYFFVGENYNENQYFLIAIIIFYYLELGQNILGNLCVNLREYKTGQQIIIVSILSVLTFYLLSDQLYIPIFLFSIYTLLIISIRILYLVEKHIKLHNISIVVYFIGALSLFFIHYFLLSISADLLLTTIGMICGAILYFKLKHEFQYLVEINN